MKQAIDAGLLLSAIVESSDDAIISKALDGTITTWNDGAQRMFGYQAKEVIGRSITILIPPERAHEETHILERIGNGERIEHYETVRRRKDGSSIDISLTISPIKDAGGRIVGASKIARDISAQLRERDLLRRSEELFRVTLSSIGDAVIATDHEGRVTFMNAVAEGLTGWTRHDAAGQPLERCFWIINEHSREPADNPVGRVLREGVVVGLANDTVLVSKDGTARPIDDSAAPIRNTSGAVVGVVLVFRDVSERRARALEAQRLAGIVANSSDAIYSASLGPEDVSNAIIQTWNRGAERLYGYAPEEIIGKPITTLIPPDLHAEERGVLARLKNGELVEPYETRRVAKDGSRFAVSLTASPLRDAKGRVVGVSKIVRDVTARTLAEAALRQSEEQFRTLADNIAQFAWMADETGSIYWFNKRWYEYTGTTLDAVRGWGWTSVHHPDHVERVLARIRASWDKGEPWEDVFPLRGKDGDYRWFLSRAQPIRDAAGRVVRWLGTNTDVTEQRAAEEALRHGALHDALTDLPNRAYFLERVSQALARERHPDNQIAVLLLDCDGFKTVNDSFGHAAGDRFLKEIAARLRTCVRPGDAVARLGGDEFTLLLEQVTGHADVERAARRIQDAFAEPLSLDGWEVAATASIGAALSGSDHVEPQDLLRDADLAMYHAKQQGRGRYQLFDASMRDSAQARFDFVEELRGALERHEFRLLFQPMVELETGRVQGLEALLRWHRPKRGVVAPLDFVALAEEAGLILRIGRWVLQEACRHARSWQDTARIPISVNLFAKHFEHPDVVDEVRTAIQDSGVTPADLVLEVSERVLMRNVETSKAVLQRLRDAGVAVYMDDFGVASSSLPYLSQLPLLGIKVDRSLVQRVGGRRIDLDIVRSVVDLARSLDLRVIAEGVETVAQRERLIAFGCEVGQGHLFAKPLDPKATGVLLAKTAGLDRRSA